MTIESELGKNNRKEVHSGDVELSQVEKEREEFVKHLGQDKVSLSHDDVLHLALRDLETALKLVQEKVVNPAVLLDIVRNPEFQSTYASLFAKMKKQTHRLGEYLDVMKPNTNVSPPTKVVSEFITHFNYKQKRDLHEKKVAFQFPDALEQYKQDIIHSINPCIRYKRLKIDGGREKDTILDLEQNALETFSYYVNAQYTKAMQMRGDFSYSFILPEEIDKSAFSNQLKEAIKYFKRSDARLSDFLSAIQKDNTKKLKAQDAGSLIRHLESKTTLTDLGEKFPLIYDRISQMRIDERNVSHAEIYSKKIIENIEENNEKKEEKNDPFKTGFHELPKQHGVIADSVSAVQFSDSGYSCVTRDIENKCKRIIHNGEPVYVPIGYHDHLKAHSVLQKGDDKYVYIANAEQFLSNENETKFRPLDILENGERITHDCVDAKGVGGDMYYLTCKGGWKNAQEKLETTYENNNSAVEPIKFTVIKNREELFSKEIDMDKFDRIFIDFLNDEPVIKHSSLRDEDRYNATTIYTAHEKHTTRDESGVQRNNNMLEFSPSGKAYFHNDLGDRDELYGPNGELLFNTNFAIDHILIPDSDTGTEFSCFCYSRYNADAPETHFVRNGVVEYTHRNRKIGEGEYDYTVSDISADGECFIILDETLTPSNNHVAIDGEKIFRKSLSSNIDTVEVRQVFFTPDNEPMYVVQEILKDGGIKNTAFYGKDQIEIPLIDNVYFKRNKPIFKKNKIIFVFGDYKTTSGYQVIDIDREIGKEETNNDDDPRKFLQLIKKPYTDWSDDDLRFLEESGIVFDHSTRLKLLNRTTDTTREILSRIIKMPHKETEIAKHFGALIDSMLRSREDLTFEEMLKDPNFSYKTNTDKGMSGAMAFLGDSDKASSFSDTLSMSQNYGIAFDSVIEGGVSMEQLLIGKVLEGEYDPSVHIDQKLKDLLNIDLSHERTEPLRFDWENFGNEIYSTEESEYVDNFNFLDDVEYEIVGSGEPPEGVPMSEIVKTLIQVKEDVLMPLCS